MHPPHTLAPPAILPLPSFTLLTPHIPTLLAQALTSSAFLFLTPSPPPFLPMPRHKKRKKAHLDPPSFRPGPTSQPNPSSGLQDSFQSAGCDYALLATNGLHRPPCQHSYPILHQAVTRLSHFVLAQPTLKRKELSTAWSIRNLHRALSNYAKTLNLHMDPLPTAAQPLLPPPPLPPRHADPVVEYCIRLGLSLSVPSPPSSPSSSSSSRNSQSPVPPDLSPSPTRSL